MEDGGAGGIWMEDEGVGGIWMEDGGAGGIWMEDGGGGEYGRRMGCIGNMDRGWAKGNMDGG